MHTLTYKALQDWAARSDAVTASCVCPAEAAAGWISYPVTLDPAQCTPVGTLVEDPYAEATFAEYHAAGTRYESATAPIAPRWYPYNRCQLTLCRDCGRAYLQYTEAGGYFVDRRIRTLRADLLADAPAPP